MLPHIQGPIRQYYIKFTQKLSDKSKFMQKYILLRLY